MMVHDLIDAKDVIINDSIFIISKFPATVGREIITQYVPTATPKVGDYAANEELMLKLMKYVAVPMGNGVQKLITRELVDNHTKSWETLMKLEWAMMEYNCSFFQNGRISTFLGDVAQNIPQWISKTLTALSVQLSQAEKQRSTNSEQSTV